jgi:type IX secretion system PorP/SprF family membrane protein
MNFKQKIQLLVLLLVVFFFSKQSIGQQLPFFNQSQDTYNPAAINGDYHKYNLPTQAGIRYSYQWMQIENAPRTLNAHFSHWNEDYNLSIGGNLISDQTGPTSFTGIYGKAAYGIEINQDWMITAGLTGGIIQYRVNGDKLHFLEPGELQNGALTKIFPDFGIGATAYFDDKYYFGLNVPQVFGLNLNFRDEQNNINTTRVRHYYANAGAYLELRNDSFLELAAEVRYVENTPLLVAAQLRHIYKEIFWLGINGTSARAVGIDAGVMWNTTNYNIIKLGYALTNHFQPYGPQFGSTHEIGLSPSW